MKGLVFGNSHVAAVLEGWRKARPIDVDFFAVPWGGGPGIAIIDGRIFPSGADMKVQTNIKEARTDGLDLSPYDYIAFCSLGLYAVRERFLRHVLRELSLAELKRADSHENLPVSEALLEKAVRVAFSEIPAVTALRGVRSLFDGPIICAPTPLPVVDRLDDAHPLRRLYGSAVAEFISWFGTRQLELMREFAGSLEPTLTILDFPNMAWLTAGATPTTISANGKIPGT